VDAADGKQQAVRGALLASVARRSSRVAGWLKGAREPSRRALGAIDGLAPRGL
jgi:hypothetical protein